MPSVSYFKKRHRLVIALAAVVAVSAASWAADSHKAASTQATGSAAFAPMPATQAAQAPPVQNATAVAAPALPAGGSSAVSLPPQPSLGTDAIPSDDQAYNDLVSKLGKEHYVLTLQSQNAELKKKIADSSNEGSLPAPSVIVAPPASMTPQSGVPGAPARGDALSITLPDSPHADASSAEVLRLTSVIIVGGSYQATLVDHGVDCTVHVGSTLSEGWYVDRIAPSSIELTHGRRHRVLHVSG